MQLEDIVDPEKHPLSDPDFVGRCRAALDKTGVLVLHDFIRADVLKAMRADAAEKRPEAYFCTQNHSVYLTPQNAEFDADHPANRLVTSSKGCICDDQVDDNTALRSLYVSAAFRAFVSAVTGQSELHAYADPLSSINVHYAERG